MAPSAAERMSLEPKRSSRLPDWVKEQGCGELGAAIAGPASWVGKLATTPHNNHHALLLR